MTKVIVHIVYFVGRGKLGYYIDELHVHIIYEEIRDKTYFGEIEFFFSDQREVNVKGLTTCELLILSREDLYNKLFPEFSDLKIEMIIEAAARRDRLKALREEAELRRREQYKRARGLPLTLSSNEIERLHEMQPVLGSELFEGGVEVVSFQGGEEPAEPLFVPVAQVHNTEEKEEITPLKDLEPAILEREKSPVRREKRSATTPYSALDREEDGAPDLRKAKLSELRTLLNSHTLAMLDSGPKAADEVGNAFIRIESSLERIESMLNAFASGNKPAQRRGSLFETTAPFG